MREYWSMESYEGEIEEKKKVKDEKSAGEIKQWSLTYWNWIGSKKKM